MYGRDLTVSTFTSFNQFQSFAALKWTRSQLIKRILNTRNANVINRCRLTTIGSRGAVVVVLLAVVVAAVTDVRLTDSPLAIVLTRTFGESADAVSAADGCRRIGEESAK